jgi:hypothetical protein
MEPGKVVKILLVAIQPGTSLGRYDIVALLGVAGTGEV